MLQTIILCMENWREELVVFNEQGEKPKPVQKSVQTKICKTGWLNNSRGDLHTFRKKLHLMSTI